MLHGHTAFDGQTLAALSLQIRRCMHRTISPSLSPPAAAVLRACIVREPMMRAGPRQLECIYLKAWARAVNV